MKLVPALILALLLAPPIGIAEPAAITGTFSAFALEAFTNSTARGNLVASLLEDGVDSTEGGPVTFSLTGSATRIEVDSADIAIHAGALAHRNQPQTDAVDYQSVVMDALTFKPGYRWNAFSSSPLKPAHVELQSQGCLKATPQAASSIERIAVVNHGDRPPTIRDTSRATSVTCLAGSTLSITGDFALSLWAVDVAIYADDENWVLQTGRQRTQALPGAMPDLSGQISQDVEAYVFVSNGTLTIPVVRANHLVLLESVHIETAGGILHGATGVAMTPTGEVVIEHDTVWLGDDSSLEIQKASGETSFWVHAQTSELRFDGRLLTVSVHQASQGAVWGPVVLAVVGVILVAAGTQLRPWWTYSRYRAAMPTGVISRPRTWRELRGSAAWVLGCRSVKAGRIERADILSQRSLRLFPNSVDAKILRANVQRSLGNLDESLQVFEQLYGKLEKSDARAEVACRIAAILVKLDLHDEAVEWLKDAAMDDIARFEAEIGNSCFDPLKDDPWFDGARLGCVRDELERRRELGLAG